MRPFFFNHEEQYLPFAGVLSGLPKKEWGVDDPDVEKWWELALIQCNVADRWLGRGSEQEDLFAKFFFFFAGFNALYFLWGQVDDVRNQKDEPAGEGILIRYLLEKFSETQASEILGELNPTIDFFLQRRPIQRMDRRDWEHPGEGSEDEGRKWSRRLEERPSHIEKLVALGSILYLVRSNLVHGSKSESGDDRDIIFYSVPALRLILKTSLSVTESKFKPWG